MNERILELARQVWPDPSTSHVNHEKFAQLIILECASLFPQTFTDEQYQRRIDKSIKKHFGV